MKSKEIAVNRRKKNKYSLKKIASLEEELVSQPSEKNFENLDICKTELEKIHVQKTQSLIIQSRI